MITIIKEAIEIMALEQGKLQDCDMWIGRDCIRHATAVMLVEDNVLYFHCKELLRRYDDSDDEVNQGDYSYSVTYDTDENIVFAHSLEEAKADANILTEEINAKRKKEKENIMHNLLGQFATLTRKLKEQDYDIREELAKTLREEKQFEPLRNFIQCRMNFYERNDDFNEDVQIVMTDVFQGQRIRFDDADNSDITTTIPLANITAVETHITYCGKPCVGVHTTGKQVYHIYKEKAKYLYRALSYLYE